MKLIIIVLSTLLSTSVAMAISGWGPPTVRCDSVELDLWGHPIFSINLTKQGIMDNQEPFTINFTEYNESDGKILTNSDATFNVTVLEKLFFYSEEKLDFGFIFTKSNIKTFAVKIKISSNRIIGNIITGCIPTPVQELTKDIFCREIITTRIN